MASATIYKIYKKGYLIHANRKVVSGFRIASEPFIQIAENDADINTIADAIKASLNNDDVKRVADPKNWAEFNKEYLKKTGLKSLKELYKPTTKNISIAKEKDKIIFTPTRPAEKPDEGFLHKSKYEAITISVTASNKEIVEALDVAFNRCD